jgi:hypothetical protein
VDGTGQRHTLPEAATLLLGTSLIGLAAIVKQRRRKLIPLSIWLGVKLSAHGGAMLVDKVRQGERMTRSLSQPGS